MVTCEFCGREMLEAESCTKNAINLPAPDEDPTGGRAGEVWTAVRYGDEERWEEFDGPEGRCHDCGVRIGGFHHPGCDMEEAPFAEIYDTPTQLLSVVLGAPAEHAPRHAKIQGDGHADISMDDVVENGEVNDGSE